MQSQEQSLILKTSSVGRLLRPAPLLRFVATPLVGPFAILAIGGDQDNNLPWFFWVLILLVLVVVIVVGFLRFSRVSHEPDDISISPDRR